MYTIFSNIKKNCGWCISLSHFHNGKVAQPTRMLAWINGSLRTYPSPDPSFRSGDFCWVKEGVAAHLVRNWLESVCTMKKKESHLKNNVVEWAGPNQTAFFFPSFFPVFFFIYLFFLAATFSLSFMFDDFCSRITGVHISTQLLHCGTENLVENHDYVDFCGEF